MLKLTFMSGLDEASLVSGISGQPPHLLFPGWRKSEFFFQNECYFGGDELQKAELKGANAAELETQIDLLVYEAYPRKRVN